MIAHGAHGAMTIQNLQQMNDSCSYPKRPPAIRRRPKHFVQFIHMPELPEVETVRLQLLHKIKDKTIKAVEVFHSKSVKDNEDFEDLLVGKTVSGIDRVGKLMIFCFKEDSDLYMLAHLKMTGQFFFVEDGEVETGGGHSMTESDFSDLPGKHTRAAFYFEDGSALYFNDMRIFGYLVLASKSEMLSVKGTYGPEPITDDFDVEEFYKKLKKKTIYIKPALLDQKFVAGLGNIYVDEALWMAGVKPTRRSNKVTKAEAAAIAAASGDVMKRSIELGGTTFQSFKDTGGENGNFKDFLQVFGKQGAKCPRCGEIIKKIKLAGRGTHYCPGCQK